MSAIQAAWTCTVLVAVAACGSNRTEEGEGTVDEEIARTLPLVDQKLTLALSLQNQLAAVDKSTLA